ncbi:TolC family protein [Maridesulfovibrio ferrireducens]|uniref:TolC family protein n=1 Tax=Maridesulfovibrio ferrireducens TaxID=246191 RepID=UPI001A352856|nr:TolC family protein [Maridesulfovibrio ferrireducens]MBI9112373.1 TolC family protein [Maridesulfovibrio ferrireducens]
MLNFNRSIILLLLLTACAPKSGVEMRNENLAKDLAFTKQAEMTLSGQNSTSNATTAESSGVFSGKAITLRDAIDFALKNNLDAAVSEHQVAVQREMLTGSYWRMLPSLMSNAEFSTQDWYTPSSSKSFQSGQQSLEPSISHDLETSTQSAELSWNLLNLAVDFQRTYQSENQLGMSKQQLKRVKQNLIVSVAQAYMRCAIAKDAAGRADSLIERALNRQKVILKQMEAGNQKKKDALNGQISIIKLRDSMRRFKYDYRQAKKELAKLLGLSPSFEFSIDGIDLADVPDEMPMDLPQWEKEALAARPEMFEMDLKEDEALREADIALTQMFPALTPFARYSRDDNSYMSRHQWCNVGMRVSWDLFTIPRLSSDQQTGMKKAAVARKQRQAQALAILVQLNLATIEYRDAYESLAISTELEKSQDELQKLIDYEVKSGAGESESILLQTNQQYLEAHVKRLTSYSDLIIAKAKIYNSMGRDIDQQDLTASTGINSSEAMAADNLSYALK